MIDLLSSEKTANFLISDCRERGENLTNLKLQKLLYYSQAWHLALKGIPLFSEDFQAWVHGPVLPSQYHRFKKNEWRPILDEIPAIDIDNQEIVSHLKEIVDVFGVETATSLELMTHNEKPWQLARKNMKDDEPSSAIISKDSMKAFYRTLQ